MNPFGGLAQLGERLPCKQEVTGSIPVLSTKRSTGSPTKPSEAGLLGGGETKTQGAFNACVKCADCGFDFDEIWANSSAG